ncbi:hypothetical protein AB0F93_28350 [Micromonospora tulbaghiae]|uniref:hypothetical protein n=1 Tax=Micromonospora tulbaghiae TaxID=479978 RepID=UPI00331CC04D
MSGQRGERGDRDKESLLAARQDILARHCRLSGSGRPLLCAPRPVEKAHADAMWRQQGNDRKAILLDKDHAEQAAREMSELYGEPRYVYRCPRSKRGHYHLTKNRQDVPPRP